MVNMFICVFLLCDKVKLFVLFMLVIDTIYCVYNQHVNNVYLTTIKKISNNG